MRSSSAVPAPAAQPRGWLSRRPLALGALAAGILLLGWVLSGIRTLDASREIAIASFPGIGAFEVRGGFAIVPRFLGRLERYPRGVAEVPLPTAAEAGLRGSDGSVFGFKGKASVTVRPADWALAHAASGGEGLPGILVAATRAAAATFRVRESQEILSPKLSHELKKNLAREMSGRGVDLKDVTVDGLDFLAAPAGATFAPADTRLLVIGLDGADWAILDPLVAKGRMPHLKRLLDEGVRANLVSIVPTLSPVVWTSIATGVDPARHGILDFLVADAGGKEAQPVTSSQRRVDAVWEILSRAGVTVGVVGWWATWPADPVRGYMVTDRVAYQLFGFRPDVNQAEGKTWPADLYEEVRQRIVQPDRVGWDRVAPYLSGPRTRPEEFDSDERKMIDDFRTLVAAGETYLAAALAARERFDPAFEAVYFEGTDTVGHLFMSFRPPLLPGVDRRRFESFQAMVDRYYETVDGYIGRLLEGREGWTVMLLSDHGFATDERRPLSTDSRIGHGPAADWHRRYGILALSGPHVRRGAAIAEAGVLDVAPTILALFGQPVPRSWPGHVLAEALEPGFVQGSPVRFTAEEYARGGSTGGESPEPVDPAAADLREKLRSLGYISDSGQGTSRATTQNNLGITLLAQGKAAEAERAFREGLRDDPGQGVLNVNLGIALRAQRKLQEARRVLESVLPFPVTRREAGHMLAQVCMDEGDLPAAERYLRDVLRVEPGATGVINTLGLVLEKEGRFREAEGEYRRAAELDAQAAEPRNNLGNLAKREGRFEDAEARYLEAIQADPYFTGSYNNLALVYQELGEMEKAIDLYGEALARSPRNAIILNNLASLYFATGEGAEAERLWKRSAETDPRYPSPVNNLAGVALAAGRLDEAEKLLDQALRLDPSYGDAYLNLALLHQQRKNAAAARSALESAARDPRARAPATVRLAVLDLTQGGPQRALERLRALGAEGERQPAVLNLLGEAQRRLGRPAEAARAWRASLTLNPRQESVRRALEELKRPG